MPVIDNGTVVRHVTPPSAPRALPSPFVIDPRFLLPGTYDFTVYRGDTYEWWFKIRSVDKIGPTIVPVNITGWRFKAEIRAAPDAPLMASLQEMARDPLNGVIAMRLIHDQSRLITASGVWDLQAIMPDGWVRTCIRGKVTLVADVSTGKVDY